MSNCDDGNDCHIETIDGMIILQSTPAGGAMIPTPVAHKI